MQQFGAIFKIFGRAVFEAIEVKGRSMLNFETVTFDLNGLKNGMRTYFENSLKAMQIVQRLIRGMNCR